MFVAGKLDRIFRIKQDEQDILSILLLPVNPVKRLSFECAYLKTLPDQSVCRACVRQTLRRLDWTLEEDRNPRAPAVVFVRLTFSRFFAIAPLLSSPVCSVTCLLTGQLFESSVGYSSRHE